MTPFDIIRDFILDHVEGLPAEKQIPIYLALAELTADGAEAAKLTNIAHARQAVVDAQLSLGLRPAKRGAYNPQR